MSSGGGQKRSIESRNRALRKSESKNPSVYWDLLKRTVGLKQRKSAIPDEVLFDGVIACGEGILDVWREAFRRLGAVDDGAISFKADFLEQMQQEVRSEVVWSHHFDSLNMELNSPIVEEEVLRVIANLNWSRHGDSVKRSFVWSEYR